MITEPSKPLRIVVIIAVVALAIRIIAGLTVGWYKLLPAADQPLYDAFAKNILAGKGFQIPDIAQKTSKGKPLDMNFDETGYFGMVIPDRPTAFFPPVYPVILTASYGVLGSHPGSARIFQSLFDALTCFLVGWMGVRLFGSSTGIIASVFYSLYPAFVGLTTVLWTIGTGVFTLVLAIALTVSFQRKPTGWNALWMGLAWGLTALSRSAILPFLIVVLYIAWRTARTWKYPALILLGMLVLLMPWGIRNAVVMGHFTLTPTKGGRNLWESNNGLFSKPYIDYSATAGGIASIYHKYVQSRIDGIKRPDLIEFPDFPREMDEFQRDRILKRQVADFLRANPKVAVELCFLRLYSLIRVTPAMFSHIVVKLAGILSMGLVLIGAVVSLIIHRKRFDQLMVFYLLILYYVAIHTVTAASIPHRLPLDALLIILSSSAIIWTWLHLVHKKC